MKGNTGGQKGRQDETVQGALIRHLTYRETIEKMLDNLQGREEKTRRTRQLLLQRREEINDEIERYPSDLVFKVRTIRNIVAQVGPQKAVEDLRGILPDQDADTRKRVVQTVVRWEAKAGLRGNLPDVEQPGHAITSPAEGRSKGGDEIPKK
jgi:hypothetical protein